MVHGGYEGETHLADYGCRGYRGSPAASRLWQQFVGRELEQFVNLERLVGLEHAGRVQFRPGGNFLACMVTDTGGINDGSFNQTSWKGLQDAAAANPERRDPQHPVDPAEH